MENLRRCTRCITPETHETITFDEEGVCNICRGQETKQQKIDWEARKADLIELVEEHRGKYEYDCIVPFSGGKDSTWTVYYLVKELKVRPLVVRFDHGFLRPNVLENTNRTIRKLGVALHHFTPNWKVVQKLMLQALLEKGDFCWHCHTGVCAYPMWVALRYRIPLIFWGEPSAEYTAYYSYDQPEVVDEKRFHRMATLGISAQDMYVRLEGAVDEKDLLPFTYPPLKELRALNYRSVCLGSYIPWDVKIQSQIIQTELGWKGDEVENVPPGYNYEKIECAMQGVRDYIKFLKRGYSRPTHLTSIDIRNRRMERSEALKIIGQFEGKRPSSLDLFLEFVGLTEDEFLEIVKTHEVSPFKAEMTNLTQGARTHDFEQWDRSGAMNRSDAQQQLNRWKEQNSKV
jgi:N-acetyl sugar amidotransferase